MSKNVLTLNLVKPTFHCCLFSLEANYIPRIFFSLSDISKVQDDEVGDGTTSVTVLAAELLRVSFDVATFHCLLVSCSAFQPNLPSTGGRAPDRKEDPPSDDHLWLEEGHSGGPRGSEGGGHGPQVSWTSCLSLNF